MISSLYHDGDEPLSGIIANYINHELGKILCLFSEKTGRNITLNQLSNCECMGIIFFEEENIGYFLTVGGNLQIDLLEQVDNSEYKNIIYNMVVNNILLYYPNILDNNEYVYANKKEY